MSWWLDSIAREKSCFILKMATSDVIGMKKPGGSFFSHQSAAETFRPIIFESVAAMRVKKNFDFAIINRRVKEEIMFCRNRNFQDGAKNRMGHFLLQWNVGLEIVMRRYKTSSKQKLAELLISFCSKSLAYTPTGFADPLFCSRWVCSDSIDTVHWLSSADCQADNPTRSSWVKSANATSVLCHPLTSSKLALQFFPSSSLSAFLLINFHTHTFLNFWQLGDGAQTASGTQG